MAFLHSMIKQAVQDEIRRELAWLQGYDLAFSILNTELDLPQKDLSALIRMIQFNQGTLSRNSKKQYFHVPEVALNRIEKVVRQAFEIQKAGVHDSES